MDDNIKTVSIEIGSAMFARYADLPNTVSHAIAEFIDNALQSYRDNKEAIIADNPDYKFKVIVDINWDDESEKAKEIIISDNAAGLSFNSFKKAFMTAEVPENNLGLNEFGMGMKTAAAWLGNNWSVKTSALDETVERFYNFNLQYVLDNEVRELPYTEKDCELKSHYTEIRITEPTKNSPGEKSLKKIKNELASIYRQSLRAKEMELYVCNEKLEFEEYPILVAPFVKTPNEAPIEWKKNISIEFGKYKATGFIAVLRDMNEQQRGIVILRRGRVVMGADEDGRRYSPKSICGSIGSPRYKRIFGELELEGFEVSFNKNDIQDKENLEALMEVVKSEIHTKEFDLYAQAEDYRSNENRKVVNKLIKKHEASPKEKRQPIVIQTKPVTGYKPAESSTPKTLQEPISLGSYSDSYKINGVNYKLNVEYVEGGDDLFWTDISKRANNEITCKINTSHIFFSHFGKPSDAITAILKTLSIAKFTAEELANDTARDLVSNFNQYIKETKV